MTFLRRYGYSSIAFNMLVASFAIQWSTITSGVFQFVNQATSNESDCCTIKVGMETYVCVCMCVCMVCVIDALRVCVVWIWGMRLVDWLLCEL